MAVARPVSWRGLRLRRECQPGPERRRSLRDADAGASPSLSRYASSLVLSLLFSCSQRSRWRSAWDGSAGQAGQRFGRISNSIAASDLYVVASAAVVLCEAVFFACCPASLLFLFFLRIRRPNTRFLSVFRSQRLCKTLQAQSEEMVAAARQHMHTVAAGKGHTLTSFLELHGVRPCYVRAHQNEEYMCGGAMYAIC